MPQTTAEVDTCRVHRFRPSTDRMLTTSVTTECKCGQGHGYRERRTLYQCVSCPFTITMPLEH